MAKRAFDLLAAAAGLLLLLPVLVIVALSVRVDSPGPVIFKQVRVGLRGAPFRILKFRTMLDGSGGTSITVKGDRRITRVGRFLRSHKLDELPQLFNVLVGDMSLVGPRPEVPEFVDLYPPEVRKLILSVRPGITDPTSISLIDESEMLAEFDDPEKAYAEIVLPRKIRLQAEYVENRSLGGDLGIILATVRALWVRGRG